MTQKTAILSIVGSARTIPQLFAAKARAENRESAQALPALAELDRRAPGWLTILVGGVARLLLSFVLFLGMLIPFAWVWALVGQLLYLLLTQLYPGQETWLAVVLTTAVCGLMYLDKNLYETITSHDLWPADEPMSRVEKILLLIASRLTQFMMLLMAGFFLLFAVLPVLLAIWAAVAQLRLWFGSLTGVWPFIRAFYLPLLLCLAALLFLVVLLKRWSRQSLLVSNALVFGVIGLYLIGDFLSKSAANWLFSGAAAWLALVWSPESVGFPWSNLWVGAAVISASYTAIALTQVAQVEWTTLLIFFVLLALLYPLGIARPLTQFWLIPFRAYSHAWYWLSQRVRLRWQIWRTIRRKKQRNKEQIANNAWETVCQEHLRRFVKTTVRRSYRRRLSFAYCPVCQRDTAVYNGVKCLAVYLADGFFQAAEQVGPTLRLNGLRWMQNARSEPLPVFDAVIIGQVQNEHDIELFFTEYGNQYSVKPKEALASKPLTGMTAQVVADYELDENLTNLLRGIGVNLFTDYDAEQTPIPCRAGIRAVEVAQQYNRRTYGALKRLALLALLILLVALLLSGGLAWLLEWLQLLLARFG